MKPLVLFVDDDYNTLRSIERTFNDEPYDIATAKDAAEALRILRGVKADVIVTDQKMPGFSGTELLNVLKNDHPQTIRIMLTGEGNLETAKEAINNGEIYRFYTKPYNTIELGLGIREALEQKQLLRIGKRLLDLAKMQSAYIDHLEDEYPGISNVRRDSSGAILVSTMQTETSALLEELEAELEREKERLE